MVSSWHRGPAPKFATGSGRKKKEWPDFEKVVAAVVVNVQEKGQTNDQALRELFDIRSSSEFAYKVKRDPRVIEAMKVRAKINKIRGGKYSKGES